MNELRGAAMFAARLYRQRASTALAAYVRRDKLARLQLRPGRVDPYSIYAQIRAEGPILPTRTGGLVTPSHRICSAILRDRRFGTMPPEGISSEQDNLDVSFLGMNPPDHTRLRKLALPSFSPKAVATYDTRIRQTVGSLLDNARNAGSFDLVSSFAAEGDQIQPAELWPLFIAGFETTVNLLGNGVLALLAHPEQWHDLCADPAALAPKVVEETLRFDPPVQATSRYALEDLELEGTPMHKGQEVTTLLGAANRDPEVYDRLDVFDIHRDKTTDHLAFSSGIHYCAGAPLARLEATIAFQMVAERMPGLRRTGPVRRRNATTIRGPLHMPVTAGPEPVRPAPTTPAARA